LLDCAASDKIKAKTPTAWKREWEEAVTSNRWLNAVAITMST
jgi:hypothetical protein